MTHTSTAGNDQVDLGAGNSFSAFAHQQIQSTFKNSLYVEVTESAMGNFRKLRTFSFKNLPPGVTFALVNDGIGTKVVLTDAAGMYETSAADLLAMTCNDITRKGGLPLVVTNTLNVAALGEPDSELNIAARKLLSGLVKYAKEERVVVFNGETAELKGLKLANSNPTLSYLWESTTLGAFEVNREITGERIRPGDIILAFRDESPGSNGITELRNGLAKMYGSEWWDNPDAAELVGEAAMPCRLYDYFLTTLNGWYELPHRPNSMPYIKAHGIAHVSGGGIPEKLAGDLLFPQGYGAELYDLFSPPQIFHKVSSARRDDFASMADEDYAKRLYDMWHSGQRLLMVVKEDDAPQVMHMAKQFGHEAKIAGKVIPEPVLKMRNYYFYGANEILTWTPNDVG